LDINVIDACAHHIRAVDFVPAEHIVAEHGRVSVEASVNSYIVSARIGNNFLYLTLPVDWQALISVRSNVVKPLVVVALQHTACDIEVKVHAVLHRSLSVVFTADGSHLTDRHFLIDIVVDTAEPILFQDVGYLRLSVSNNVHDTRVGVPAIYFLREILVRHAGVGCDISNALRYKVWSSAIRFCFVLGGMC